MYEVNPLQIIDKTDSSCYKNGLLAAIVERTNCLHARTSTVRGVIHVVHIVLGKAVDIHVPISRR